MTDTVLQPWPVCPRCGHKHRDAWEWSLGPGLDGSGEHDCDECGNTFHVERVVTVDYTTATPNKCSTSDMRSNTQGEDQ